MKMYYKDKEFLIEEYINQQKPIWKIAKNQLVAYGTIHYWLKKHNIKSRNKSECVKGNHVELTKRSLEFIEGELLGDGCLSPYKNISARYTHSSKYKTYLKWLSNKLSEFGIEQVGIIQKSQNILNGKRYIIYKYTSKFYRELVELSKKWYPDGKKIVPRNLELTPIMVRQWYIGDGCLVKPKKGNPWIQFSTDAFDNKSLDLLTYRFLKDVEIAAGIRSNNRLCLSCYTVNNFLNYIGECPSEIEEIYGYKWDINK
jgi:hypothetical protein